MGKQWYRNVMTATVLALGLLVSGCAVGRGSSARGTKPVAVEIPEPLDIASPQVVGYLVVPDLEATMDHIEEIAAAFAPDKVQPGMLKGQLGQVLGDPNLVYLDEAMPLVVMLLRSDTPTEPPPVVGCMSYTKEQPYAETAERWGVASRIGEDVLMVSNTSDTLDAAEALIPLYRKIRTAAITSDVRVTFYMRHLTDIYGSTVRAWLDRMVGSLGALAAMSQPGGGPNQSAWLAKILRLEMNALLAVLADIEVVQSDVSFNTEALTIDRIAVARHGSRLEDLFNSPAVGENYAVGLLSEPGFLMYAAQVDPKRLSNFVVEVLRKLSEDPEAAEILTPEVVALYEDMDTWLTGDMAVSMRSIGELPFVSETAMGVRDAAKSLAMVERGMSLVAPGGPFDKLYQEMGTDISTALEKDVRYRAGLPVHRVKIAMEMPTAPEGWATHMKGMMKDTEFAFAGGYYLAAQDATALNSSIDRALADVRTDALTFHARDLFGPGQHVYGDLDVVGLMKAFAAAVPPGMPNQLKPLVEQVSCTEPIAFVMAVSGGRARAQARVPLSPFMQMVAAARESGRGHGAKPTSGGE